MERLTEKVNDYWKTNDKAHIYYLDTNESFFVGNVIDRLAEFEDFMEEQGLESLEELKKALEVYNFANKLISNEHIPRSKALQIYELVLEMVSYKHRWQKLKENIEHYTDPRCKKETAIVHQHILDKMQELEKE